MMVQLTGDIVEAALLHAYFAGSSNLKPNQALLRNTALVCRAWLEPSQRLLFRCVHLAHRKRAAAFTRACLTGPRAHALRGAVRILQVELAPHSPDTRHNIRYEDLEVIIGCTPYLFDLRLLSVTDDALQRLQLPMSLRALTLTLAPGRLPVSFIQSYVPQLTYLSISQGQAEEALELPAELLRLRALTTSIPIASPCRLAEWSLTRISFHGYAWMSPPPSLPKSVRSLSVDRWNDHVVQWLEVTPALAELELNYILKSFRASIPLVPSLPSTLQHLLIDTTSPWFVRPEKLQEEADAVLSLPEALRLVTFRRVQYGHITTPLETALCSACAERCIEWKEEFIYNSQTTSTIDLFASIPPTSATSFPLQHSPDDFVAMSPDSDGRELDLQSKIASLAPLRYTRKTAAQHAGYWLKGLARKWKERHEPWEY